MNTDTKRHIDSARQVLVGVVPNPTSQIDQITNALIYKFMDDMDQSAIKAGGSPSFFINDLEPYAWTRLMDSRIGNQERMNLYSEALIKFSQAKQLPELFRSIFKSAFLPYRSPETLGLFLKEISYFDYSHPEELGNAYEYLLSIMSSQGDAGQFRTPRHIIDFIVDVINPSKDDKVLDPACGTGGFLISSYTHILEQHDGKDDPKKKEKLLTPDDRKKMMGNFEGYDIDPTMVRIAQVNMYLHQFKNPKIFQYDSLSNEERWNDKFDVILANPPFMSPKGGITPHSKFSIQSSRSEVLFTDYIMNHLRPKGRAGIIVPEGIIFQSGNAHKQLRKNLVEDGLYAVVSLPSGVFNPYAGVKTSILLFNNELAKTSTEILFVKIEADGFDLGATKRPISKNDLPTALDILNKWNTGEKVENKLAVYVEKSKIAENGDYNLSGDRYRSVVDYSKAKWPMVFVKDVAFFQEGPGILSTQYVTNGYPMVNVRNVQDGYLDLDVTKYVSNEIANEKWAHFRIDENDILFTTSGTIGRVARVKKQDLPLLLNTSVVRFRSLNKKELYTDYLYYSLKSEQFVNELLRLKTGSGQFNVGPTHIKTLKIPLPPLEIQEQIVTELNGYAGIIAGAKQIAQNWKPKIDIDPEWNNVELGEVCDFIDYRGKTPQKTANGIPLITAKNIKKGYINENPKEYIAEEDYESWMTRGLPKTGDVLITTEAPLGNVALVDTTIKFALAQRIINLSPKDNNLIGGYLMYVLLLDELQNSLVNNQSGSTVYGIKASTLKTIKIPLPTLVIQKQIVEKIESERTLVESAKKLIDIYEQKTKETIAKLWQE
jgi:type I restriction enzyme M protein